MLTIVLLYAAFLGVGWLAGRKNPDRTPADFIVAGRAMPLWLATFTMTATWVDGGYLLGTAEGVYRSSIATGLQGGVCFGLSLILGGVLFAKRMRAFGFTTLIDLFEARFGPRWAVVLSTTDPGIEPNAVEVEALEDIVVGGRSLVLLRRR